MFFNIVPSSVVFLGMFLTSSLYYIPTSFCQFNVQYESCLKSFRCANIPDLYYPFWGGDRPAHCGYPAFQLSCQGDIPIINLQSRPYRVLGVDTKSQVIIVARQDFWNNTCPSLLYNTDLDYRLFRHPSGDQNLTLSYGCSKVPGQLSQYEFFCKLNETSLDSYFYTQSVFALNSARVNCSKSITIPINQTSAQLLSAATSSEDDLSEVLKVGFGLIWEVNNTRCFTCVGSGGRCGYNSSTSSFACYCNDRTYPSVCIIGTLSDDRKVSGNKSLVYIPVTGLVVLGIIYVCYAIIHVEGYSNQHVEAFVRNYEALTVQRYSYSDIKKMTNSFKEKLGQGGYGGVYKGKLADERPVAVKVLKETEGNGEEFINEVESISRTSHVNVVTLLGFCFERNKRALIYEFMPNKSLDKFIYDDDRFPDSNQRLESNTLYQITVGIARGLEYLHRGCNTRIVHFDIKPQNILLDEDFCPKISDFGLAKLCKTRESIISILGARGTVGYIAPEVFSRNFGGVSHKSVSIATA